MTAQPSLARCRRIALQGLAASLLMTLGACATDQAPGALKPTTAHPLPPRERVNKAIELLFQGKATEARELLVSALKEQPANDMAKKLLVQIDAEPKALLGDASYPYRARAGDTASSLAARFLGDPLMFYALARYNQIDPPSQTLEGRTVSIPGEPKAAARPGPRPQAAPAGPKSAKPSAPSPAPAPALRNGPRASDLRAAGLVQMNKGAIDRAVSLLQQAQALAPADQAIRRDLERALRIQKTVRLR
jgi:hypothetical protein